jgi:hypothetical protein
MQLVTKSLFILSFFCLIVFTNASKAELSAIEFDTLINELYKKLTTQNYLEFKEITSKGELSACSLEFGYVYRDHQRFEGNLVMLAGSWNQMYVKDKNNGYSLKLVAKLADVKKNSVNFINPKFLDLLISNTSISKYQILQNVSDNESLFQGYGDGKFVIAKSIAEGNLKGSRLRFSFSTAGFDKDVEFSTIVNKSVSDREISKFEECSVVIAEKIIKDLEKLN